MNYLRPARVALLTTATVLFLALSPSNQGPAASAVGACNTFDPSPACQVGFVGVDVDPFTTTTNTGSVLGPHDNCIAVGNGVTIEVDITVNDLPDLGAPGANNAQPTLDGATLIQAVVEYDSANLTIGLIRQGLPGWVPTILGVVPGSTVGIAGVVVPVLFDPGPPAVIILSMGPDFGDAPPNPLGSAAEEGHPGIFLRVPFTTPLVGSGLSTIGVLGNSGPASTKVVQVDNDSPTIVNLYGLDGQTGGAFSADDGRADSYIAWGGATCADDDGDGVLDIVDNCPSEANPDQRDGDSQDGGDVCDPCPNDDTDLCDTNRSAGTSIGSSGGSLTTPDGSVTITVPPGALSQDTSISITGDTNTGFQLDTPQGQGIAVFAVDIQPSGLVFSQPITLVFTWPDVDNNGKVDGITPAVQEKFLFISKDSQAITGPCGDQPLDCNQGANTFTFTVSSFSDFALVAPLDTDSDDVPDNFDGIVDACPDTPGLADRQGCPYGDDISVTLHTVDQPKTTCPGGAGSCREPVEGAEVRVFDRSLLGTQNPPPDQYFDIFETDVDRIATCTTDATGQCIAGEETTGDYLVIAKFVDGSKTVYVGSPKSDSSFVDGLAEKDLHVLKVIKKKDGSVQYSGGRVTTVDGSYLEIVYPEYSIWDEAAAGFVYPFIFTSDSDWEVDICAQVPEGYAIVGVYDDEGNFVADVGCAQTFVTAETKVLAFEVVEVGSPEPVLGAILSVEHEGDVTQLDIEVPGERTYVEEPAELPTTGASDTGGQGTPIWPAVAALAGFALLLGGTIIWRRRRA